MELCCVSWPWLTSKCVARVCQHQLSFLLHCALASGAVYCSGSCLWVAGWLAGWVGGCVGVGVCLNFGRPAPPGRGLRWAENFWLRQPARCVCFSSQRFFHLSLNYYKMDEFLTQSHMYSKRSDRHIFAAICTFSLRIYIFNEKNRSERRKHGALAVERRSQKFSPRRRPLPGGAGWPKFNQLEMVTTFTYKPSLVRIDACNFELSW